MSRLIKISSLLTLLLLMSCRAHPVSNTKSGLNAFAAAGPNFVFPTSVRIGWNSWEFGLLTSGFVGFNKTFPVSGRSIYSSFGFGAKVDDYQASPGLQVALGFNYEFFWQLSLRGEMLANACLDGNTTAHALLGIAYGF